MSRREDRDSGSRRRRSWFHTDPSPKRSRRDGKAGLDRPDADVRKGEDKKRSRRVEDVLPVEASWKPGSKEVSRSAGGETDRKVNGNGDRNKHSKASRSPSHIEQRDERGNARQLGGRSINDRGRKDEKDQQDDVKENRGNEKSHAKENDNWRHDKSREIEDDAPPLRKRRTFTEKKVPMDSEKIDNNTSGVVKLSHSDRPMQGRAKEEDRGRSSYHFDRSEKPFARNRDISRDERPWGYPSRERYGNGNSRNYRGGRDRFSRSQGHSSSNIRVEKWKHDLFEESSKSPPPKNEEEQIAKLEALLSS